jgi:hypothetical protein
MRNLMLIAIAFGVTGPVLAETPKPGDMVNNPPFVHWSQFAVGTSITTKDVVTLGDGSVEEVVATAKLVAKAPDHVSVETVVVGGADVGKTEAIEQTKTITDFPAKVKFERTHTPPSVGYSVTEGKEIVEVKGKKVEAEWVEATSTRGDEVVVEKVWTAQDVPGGIVKRAITRKKGDKIASQSALEVVTVAATPAAMKK